MIRYWLNAFYFLFFFRNENMLCFLTQLKEKHGSIEQCIIDHDLLQADGIERLRRNMIVDAAKNYSIVGKSSEPKMLSHYLWYICLTLGLIWCSCVG